MGIFIVNVIVGFGAFVKLVILTQSLIVGYCRIQRLSSCQRGFELCALLGSLCFAESEGTAVEIISPLPGLSSLVKDGLAICVCNQTETRN